MNNSFDNNSSKKEHNNLLYPKHLKKWQIMGPNLTRIIYSSFSFFFLKLKSFFRNVIAKVKLLCVFFSFYIFYDCIMLCKIINHWLARNGENLKKKVHKINFKKIVPQTFDY